jgi:TusA-related sulfurtransferase
MKTIDARGLSCPEPVLVTKKAIQQELPVTILVDQQVAVENIVRFAHKEGLYDTVKIMDNYFSILISRQ